MEEYCNFWIDFNETLRLFDTLEETNLMDSVFSNIKVTTGILKTNAQVYNDYDFRYKKRLLKIIYDVLKHMLITDL